MHLFRQHLALTRRCISTLNEPVYEFEAGSTIRQDVLQAIEKVENTTQDIPIIVGGECIYTEDVRYQVSVSAPKITETPSEDRKSATRHSLIPTTRSLSCWSIMLFLYIFITGIQRRSQEKYLGSRICHDVIMTSLCQ